MYEDIICFCSITLLSSCILIASCSTTKLESLWKNDEYSNIPLKKILIIGVDRSSLVKKLLEDEFARQLEAKGVVAVTSNEIIEYEDEMIDRKTIIAKMKQLEVDAVLITRLADVSEVEAYTAPSNPYSSDFYRYYQNCCVIVSVGYNVVIETKIFDARYDTLIWSAVTQSVFDVSAEYIVQSFVPMLIQSLYEQNII